MGLGSQVSSWDGRSLSRSDDADTPARADLPPAGFPGRSRKWISFEIGPKQFDSGGSMVSEHIKVGGRGLGHTGASSAQSDRL